MLSISTDYRISTAIVQWSLQENTVLFVLWLLSGKLPISFGNIASETAQDLEAPKGMQRRFMWENMNAMTQMIGEVLLPSADKQRRSQDSRSQASSRVKYIIKNPSNKNFKIVKIRAPKKTIHIHAMPILPQMKTVSTQMYYPSENELRLMEKQQELAVETYLHSNTNTNKNNLNGAPYDDQTNLPIYFPEPTTSALISAKGIDSSDGFIPVVAAGKPPESTTTTVKPYSLSDLHTNIFSNAQKEDRFEPVLQSKREHSYEVTEDTIEDSLDAPQALALVSPPPDAISYANEPPNYPQYFLDRFKSKPEIYEGSKNVLNSHKHISIDLRKLKDSQGSGSGRTALKISDTIYGKNKEQQNIYSTQRPTVATSSNPRILAGLAPHAFGNKYYGKERTTKSLRSTTTTTTTSTVKPKNYHHQLDKSTRGSVKFEDKLYIE